MFWARKSRPLSRNLPRYCGAKHCVGVANGLEALHLILRAYGIGEGDEVIVPSNTYIATWLAVSYAGATPVPVEPDARTFNLDPGRIEAAITPQTKAIMPVHLYGQPADMDPIMAIARQHGLKVIEDNAQAQGARYKGRRTGSLGRCRRATVFIPAKISAHLATPAPSRPTMPRWPIACGCCAITARRKNITTRCKGYNSRLDELQAAFLRVKLKKLDEWNERRGVVAKNYLEQIARRGRFDNCRLCRNGRSRSGIFLWCGIRSATDCRSD